MGKRQLEEGGEEREFGEEKRAGRRRPVDNAGRLGDCDSEEKEHGEKNIKVREKNLRRDQGGGEMSVITR